MNSKDYSKNNKKYGDKNNKNIKDDEKEIEIDVKIKKEEIPKITVSSKSKIINQHISKRSSIITPKFSTKAWAKIKENILIAVQKYNSSRKTKTVHRLVQNDMFMFCIFVGELSDEAVTYAANENKLFSIYLNADFFDDYSQSTKSNFILSNINKYYELIENEKNMITERQTYKVDKLVKDYEKYQNDFIEIIDYMKVVDGIYYGYLKFLIARALLHDIKERQKLMSMFTDILTKLFIKIYTKSTRTTPDDNIYKKIKLICTYFVLNYYGGLSQQEIMSKIKIAYGESAVLFLKKSSKLNPKTFIDINNIFFETDTFRIQKSYMETMLRHYVGDLGYKVLQNNLQEAVAFFCSINHKNIMFNAVSPDEKLTFNLEELVLNMKRMVLEVKQKPLLVSINTENIDEK